jgi:glycosyltransferase involved in cell wall biosynthesis
VDKHLIAGVDKESIAKKYAEVQKHKQVNLLFLSRLEKRKGIYELLEAFKRLRTNTDIKYTLTIGGDGFELDPMRALIQKEAIEDVQMKGFISGEEKKQAFMQAHIFVFPSHGEGMPNAVLEAMGFGLPVVTTPVGGVVDFFKDGENGCYTAINKPDELFGKISELASNHKLLTEIAISNFKLAQSRFTSDIVAGRMLKIFNEVIEPGSS